MGADRLRAVIVGCGQVAGGYNDATEDHVLTHVVAYRRLDVDVVGCCDLQPGRAESFARRWGIATHGSSLRSLLNAVRPEVVSICTPPAGRAPILRDIVECDSVRSLIVEKPLATTARDAELMGALLQEWSHPVVVNYFRAFDPFYRWLVSRHASGELGVVREVVARYYGSAWTNASHLVERLVEMLGQPTSARRLGGSSDAPLFELGFAGGPRAMFLPAGRIPYAPVELDFFFDRGRLRVIDSERRSERFVCVPDPQVPGFFTLAPSDASAPAGPGTDAFLHVVDHALRAAQTNTVGVPTLARAVAVTQILEQVCPS